MTDQHETVKYKGAPLSPGLAMGRAFVYQDVMLREQEHYDIRPEEVDGEQKRIEKAIEQVKLDLHDTARKVERQVEKKVAGIFDAQKSMLDDPQLLEEMRNKLTTDLVNAEHVVQAVHDD